MPTDHDFPPKYLARNVPEDFTGCCERIRATLTGPEQRFRKGTTNYERLYGSLFKSLSDDDLEPEVQTRIGMEFDEIQVRYIAVQKTLDLSVPAKPVFETLKGLKLALAKASRKLDDPDRESVVFDLHGAPDENQASGLAERFASTSSLAQKVSVVHNYLESVSHDLDEITEFFDYKRGLVTKGQPSKYALFYAVYALADLFERENSRGHKARVNQETDGGRGEKRGRNANLLRYTGHFLDLVMNFLWIVVPEQVGRRSHEGTADQIRGLAQKRRADPGVFRLLHGEVSTDDVLGFMKRADERK